MLNDKNYVLKQVEERDIHFVRLWFTDVLGNLKSLAVTDSEVDAALEHGMSFDASSISGFGSDEETDMVAMPIASSFQVLPWRPRVSGVARMFCEIRNPDGTPFAGDPRNVLRRVASKARDMGFVASIGPELEYYYFKDDQGTEPIDTAGFFDLTSADHASDLRRDTILTLEKMSIPVEYSHHEHSPSQQEIDLRQTDALSMADAVMTYRLVVKEIALAHGVYATFMPMPRGDFHGSGMHLHQSLSTLSGDNAFYDEGVHSEPKLSPTARSYIAGLLKYAPEYLVLTNQYVNSYKRLASRNEPTRYVCWGTTNRSALVRVPAHRFDDEGSARVELRLPDPACNPYLAFAATIAAGLAGIDEGLDLPPSCDGIDLTRMGCDERRKAGFGDLPPTLSDALDIFERSELMREVLGDHIFDFIVESKRAECEEYNQTVTPWETSRLLPVL